MGFKDWFKNNFGTEESEEDIKKESNKERNERFIEVKINFGISGVGKEYSDYIEEVFDYFQGMRLELNQDYGAPNNIKPKIVEDFYVRSKEFYIEKPSNNVTLEIKNKKMITKKPRKNMLMISFVPESKYSPIELAKDIMFIMTLSTRLTRELGLPFFEVSRINKNKGKLIVDTKQSMVDFEYPLENRIRLYKKDKELDKFIFDNDLNKIIEKSSRFKKEAKELFKKIIKE